MTPAETLFHEIAETLPDVKKGKMFGSQCYNAPNGKALVILYKETMVFKLRDEMLDEAMALDGTDFFNPSQKRPMKPWVQVPLDYQDRWQEFAHSAFDFVKSLPKK